MTQSATVGQETITVELAELTLCRAEQLGIDLSQLADELLTAEVNRRVLERAQLISNIPTKT